MLAAIFGPARVSVGHTIGISDLVLIDPNRIHALGDKPTPIGIDQPEHAIALINAKKSAATEPVIGNSTPLGSLQSKAPTAA
jgi:hypothetical protein